MTVRIVNYLGEVVIQRILPILPAKQRVHTGGGEEFRGDSWVRDVVQRWMGGGDPAAGHNCIPRWGTETAIQRGMFLLSVAIYLFAIIAIPLMLVLWLVFASVYYIYIEKELRRRERIEAQHSILKKKEI